MGSGGWGRPAGHQAQQGAPVEEQDKTTHQEGEGQGQHESEGQDRGKCHRLAENGWSGASGWIGF